MSSKQVRQSIEHDLALTVRARREQEENVAEQGRISNDRSRFELTRDQIIFTVKMSVTVFFLVMLVVSVIAGTDSVVVLASCGGTIGGAISLLFRPDPEQHSG